VCQSKIVTVNDLKSCMNQIALTIGEQCEHGVQTKELNNQKVAACGQFIGEDARNLAQRGLHGTAAAIRVLSLNQETNTSSLLERLVRYVSDRQTFERTATTPISIEKIQDDNTNIIKISELLYAISQVPDQIPKVVLFRKTLASLLEHSQIENKGWSYFTQTSTTDQDIELLPTAHAILALSSVNINVTKPINWLVERLKKSPNEASSSSGGDADISIRIFALYVLAFCNDADKVPESVLINLFEETWKRTWRLLGYENVEQNVEYWNGVTTYYLRVPWQLYLLALAARLKFRRFATRAAQTRLCSIVNSIHNNQFRYPLSGNMISSRTNAIAYDVCSNIMKERRRDRGIYFRVLLDQVKTSNWVRYISLFISIIIRKCPNNC